MNTQVGECVNGFVASDSHRHISSRILGGLDDWWICRGCIRVVDKCLGEYTCKVSACVSENKSIERVSSWLTECVSDDGFVLVDVHMSELGGRRY